MKFLKLPAIFLKFYLHFPNYFLHYSWLILPPKSPPKRPSPCWSPGNWILCPLTSRESSSSVSITAIILIGVCFIFLILRKGWSWVDLASHFSQTSKSGHTTHLYLIPTIGNAPHSSHVTWAWTTCSTFWAYFFSSTFSSIIFDSKILL